MIFYFTVPSEINSLTVTAPTASSFNITWSPPTTPNGIITGYTLIVREYEGNSSTLILPIQTDRGNTSSTFTVTINNGLCKCYILF